jgi:hypothetical protein
MLNGYVFFVLVEGYKTNTKSRKIQGEWFYRT